MVCLTGNCAVGGAPFTQPVMRSGQVDSGGGSSPSPDDMGSSCCGTKCCDICCCTPLVLNIFNTIALVAAASALVIGLVTMNPVLITIGALATSIFALAFFANCYCCNEKTASEKGHVLGTDKDDQSDVIAKRLAHFTYAVEHDLSGDSAKAKKRVHFHPLVESGSHRPAEAFRSAPV